MEGSDDLRKLPQHLRKTSLQRLLARRREGVFVNPFERGEIGPELFRAACRMGLEGLVSKHRDRPYQAGRSTRTGCIRRCTGLWMRWRKLRIDKWRPGWSRSG